MALPRQIGYRKAARVSLTITRRYTYCRPGFSLTSATGFCRLTFTLTEPRLPF